MSNGKQKIGVSGAAGVLVAALIIASFMVGGNILQAQGKGTLTIRVMDKPVELLHLNVTINWLKIQTADESWIDLALKTDPNPFYFDLLTLQDISETLSETDIPAGNYSMIQMYVLTANATYLDDENGELIETDIELNVPSDVIKVLLKPHLNMEVGGQITVLIDLQPNDRNSIAISKSLNLRPVIKAVVTN